MGVGTRPCVKKWARACCCIFLIDLRRKFLNIKGFVVLAARADGFGDWEWKVDEEGGLLLFVGDIVDNGSKRRKACFVEDVKVFSRCNSFVAIFAQRTA